MDGTGEILITILSSLAQEESRNISENTRWGVVRRFENGKMIVNHNKFMGYTKNENGDLVIVQEEAEIVRLIFRLYLEGYSAGKLCAAIKKYMVEAAKTKSEKEKVKDVTVQNLINWGVVKNVDGTLAPTNAFVLLTDNTFPFAKIQCALFKGTERVVFIDKRDFEGPLYEQIEEAYEFVLKHINLGAEISGLVRTDAYELPTEAIREAIVNATTHRNFLDRACVQVAVYDDRVEVTSPGMLYGGLTIEQIKEGGSKIRNRCIAEVFSRMKIIESWGTGIKRMFSSCKEYGIRKPELLEIGDSFRVNLYRPSYNEVHQKVHQSSPKNSPKSSPKEVNQTQQKILDMILENPEITQTTMAEKLDITPRAVKKNIKELVDKGLVEREGSARKGYWKIKE